MKNMLKFYEDDPMFDAIMENCHINMDTKSWDYTSDLHAGFNYNAQPLHLTRDCTDYPVGWLSYREWRDCEGETYNETYISIKEEHLDELELIDNPDTQEDE